MQNGIACRGRSKFMQSIYYTCNVSKLKSQCIDAIKIKNKKKSEIETSECIVRNSEMDAKFYFMQEGFGGKQNIKNNSKSVASVIAKYFDRNSFSEAIYIRVLNVHRGEKHLSYVLPSTRAIYIHRRKTKF